MHVSEGRILRRLILHSRECKYPRGLPISSLHVLECSFHVGHKWAMASMIMTRGKI